MPKTAEQDPAAEAAERKRVCPACGTRYPAGTRFCPSDGQVLRDEGSENDWLIGKLIADRYLIERQLGAGGMGVVYLAQHVYMPRRCALKVLRPEFLTNSEAVGRFAREAQNASRISHPNVAAVYDFGDAAGEVMYLAMEFVEGMSLAKVLESGTLSIARVATIVSQVASALKAAHELGIVHRDLKPDNIMLAISGESTDLVKVVDFGIARAVLETGQQVTSSGVAIGTPAYMSPEQMAGETVDARSDLYSLALVVYVMLTGTLPFGIERADLPLRYLEPPRSLNDLAPTTDWPEALQLVLNRALTSDPNERQDSVQKFVRELIDVLRGWRPDEIAASLSALTSLGADVTSALPPDLIMRWATPPVEHPALVPTGPPALRVRTRVMLSVVAAGVLGAGAFGMLALMNRGENDPLSAGVPPAQVDSSARVDTTTRVLADAPKSVPPQRRVPDPARSSRQTQPKSTQTATETAAGPDQSGRTTSDSGTTAVRGLVDTSSSPQVRPTDSTLKGAAPVQAPAAPTPTTGVVLVGTTGNMGAYLTVNGRFAGILRGMRAIEAAPGSVRLRLSLERCQDWDSTVTVTAGDTVNLRRRFPVCPP